MSYLSTGDLISNATELKFKPPTLPIISSICCLSKGWFQDKIRPLSGNFRQIRSSKTCVRRPSIMMIKMIRRGNTEIRQESMMAVSTNNYVTLTIYMILQKQTKILVTDALTLTVLYNGIKARKSEVSRTPPNRRFLCQKGKVWIL